MSKVSRSHPPSLRNIVKKTLLKECSLPYGCKILLGCSGGPDSQSLLHVMAGLQEELHFKLYAIGIDHQLRSESANEIKMAQAFSESLNVPFYSVGVRVDSGNVQNQARKIRYETFHQYKDEVGADFIATAHHADDLAETVLMKIIRGVTVKELVCMNTQYNDVLRPMLRARRRDVDLHIERKNIPVSHDPSNKDRKYLRSKVRYDIMPQLKEINPDVVGALCKLSMSSLCNNISNINE